MKWIATELRMGTWTCGQPVAKRERKHELLNQPEAGVGIDRFTTLTMGISVESRVHRVLRKLNRFRSCDQVAALPQLKGNPMPFEITESLLGAYENEVGSKHGLLLFTNQSVYLCENGIWKSLRYTDIEVCVWPTEGKKEAHTLVVKKRDGESMSFPIKGATEHGRDLFGVMRFFDRVAHDVKS